MKTKWVPTTILIIVLLAVSYPLLWFGGLLASSPVGHFVTLQNYYQGQCTILAKGLRYYSSFNQDTGNNETQYGLDFSFLVHNTPNNATPARGYGIDQYNFDQRSEAQAVLDQYQIGQSYPCWYDPGNASHAVLTQDISEWILLLPGGIMLIVGLVILIGGIRFIWWLAPPWYWFRQFQQGF